MNQAVQIDPGTRDAIQRMVALLRQGRRDEARQAGKAALPQVSDTVPIHAFLGRLACESGDFSDGIAHLRLAIDKLPDEGVIRCDLAAALIQIGDLAGALAICSIDHMLADRSLQIARFRGYAAQELGQFPEAVIAYRHVVAQAPDDAGTWNNLGNALAATGDLDGSIQASRRAATLDPHSAPTRLNFASALATADKVDEAIAEYRKMAEDFPDDPKPLVEMARLAAMLDRGEEALEAYEEGGKRAPYDPQIQLELGNQRGLTWDVAGAEQAFRAAIAADPAFGDAYVALAVLFEHGNRSGQLAALAEEAKAANIDRGLRSLIEAYVLRRAKEWGKGLAAAEAAPTDRDPVRRAQLIGEFRDRLGDAVGAFASFEEMNRQVASDRRVPGYLASRYREMVDRNRATMTREWLDSWTPPVPPQSGERASPAFLVGFPRSGTTLLDTMLMGHPGVQVIEERPALVHVEHRLGGIDGLPAMEPAAVRAARDEYWQEVSGYAELRPNSLLVDKSPLYLNKVAIIHRLFPEARFILALRHPMDVVLSCYITNFRPNPAMANFLDLRQAAELYDRSMAAFEEARKLLDLPVHTVAYERMIADRDAELRPLFDWLGLDWREDALDHQATAAKRGVITTASYSQVHEPLYTRSAGRWTRYVEQLEPVREILEPWITRLGYSIDDPTKLPERQAV
jgi:tetratricopeptide (TPR) repeat protein